MLEAKCDVESSYIRLLCTTPLVLHVCNVMSLSRARSQPRDIFSDERSVIVLQGSINLVSIIKGSFEALAQFRPITHRYRIVQQRENPIIAPNLQCLTLTLFV